MTRHSLSQEGKTARQADRKKIFIQKNDQERQLSPGVLSPQLACGAIIQLTGPPRVQKFGSREALAVFWTCGEPHRLDDMALCARSSRYVAGLKHKSIGGSTVWPYALTRWDQKVGFCIVPRNLNLICTWEAGNPVIRLLIGPFLAALSQHCLKGRNISLKALQG